MVEGSTPAHKDGDTLGGVVEVVVTACRRASARTCTGTAASTRALAQAPDEHPGDQGRRGRRRLRDWPPPRLRWRTTRSSRPPTASAAISDRAGGTEGGMTTGELAARAGGHEADRHRPARAAHRRRRAPARPPRRTTSAPTCAPSRPPASSPRRWSRSVLAEAVLEKFGGDTVAETRRNAEATSTRWRYQVSPRRRPRSARWASARPTVARRSLAETAGRRGPRHRPRRRGGRGPRDLRHLRRRRRGRTSAPASATAVAQALADPRRRARAGRGAPSSTSAGTREPARPATTWSSCDVGLVRRREAGRAGHVATAAARQRPRAGSRRCWTSAPRSTSRSPRSWS